MAVGDSWPIPESPEEMFTWTNLDAETVRCDGFAAGYEETQNIHIPSVANGRQVTMIQYSASGSAGAGGFGGRTNLKRVKIPSSVKVIGSRSFGDCGLEIIDISDGVERISRSAFYGNKTLETLDLPESVTHVSRQILGECESFEYLRIKGNINFYSNDAGDPDTWTPYTDAKIFDLVPDSAVTLEFSDTVTALPIKNANGPRQFGPGLGHVIIPDTVDVIPAWLFAWEQQLETAEIGAVNTIEAFAFALSGLEGTLPLKPGLTTVEQQPFAATQLTGITYPDTLQTLGVMGNAFNETPNLKTVIFEGNAPSVSENLYRYLEPDLTTYAPTGATGWPTGDPPLYWPPGSHQRPFEYA